MQKTFEFIDGTKHDRLTRRLARSHALKGKNVGKKLYRRSRLDLDQSRRHQRPVPVPPKSEEEISVPGSEGVHPGIVAISGDSLSIPFPIDTASQGHHIVSQCKCPNILNPTATNIS